MAFGKRRSRQTEPTVVQPPERIPDWSDVNVIQEEWPLQTLDLDSDIRGYNLALSLFERDDYPSMMQCATLLATALAHSLYGAGILHDDDLPNAVHKTLYCALCAPPDGRTLAESAQKAARMAMTVMRENSWQPPLLGGSLPHFEPMMTDRGNYHLLSAAIAPPNQPWAGDLKAFFSVPPTLPSAGSNRS